MPKNFIQDVVPPKKTIRDIPIPEHRKQREIRLAPRSTREEREYKEDGNEAPKRPLHSFLPQLPNKVILWGGLIVFIALSVLAFELFRVHATVSIYQKTKTVNVDATLSAKKEALSGELPFEVMTLSREASKIIPATGEKKVERRASGTIVIYNDYSSVNQRLIKNTRFETPKGLIYRIDSSVVVPGKKTVNGESVPGSVEALAYADVAGEAYNIGLSDFTIPGFKGDPRYSKFYARSKTPMTGGFTGTVKTASASDLKSAEKELVAEIKDGLQKDASSQRPAQFVLYDRAMYLEIQNVSAPDSNEVKIKGTFYGIIFEAKKLSEFIAKVTPSDYERGEVLGSNLEVLTFMPTTPDDRPWQSGAFSFSLSGTTTLTWLFDEEKLKQDLTSQPKERIPTVLQAHPGIKRAEVVVLPPWRSTLPEDPADISVKVIPPAE